MADPSKVTFIDASRDVVTLVNTFTLQPENQQAFVETQTGEYKRLWGKVEGQMAANLHRGHSGRKAVNYAHFRSLDEMRRWQSGDLMKDHMQVIRPLIERPQPGLYRAVEVVGRDASVARIEEGGLTVIAVATADPDALDEVVTAQRDAARRLLEELPGVRALVVHKGLQTHGGPFGPPPNTALYTQLDGEATAAALLAHPAFRAAFTTDHSRIREAESEVYTVAYVQNEAAAAAAGTTG